MAVAQIQHVQGPPVNNQSSQPQKPPKPNKPTAQKPTKQNPTVAIDYETFTVNGVSFNMVRVEGGTFMMGDSNDSPIHQVTLSSYYIGETEVTQALWEAVMGTNIRQQFNKVDFKGSIWGEGPNYPMYYVNREESLSFIKKLNQLTGKSFRLPTEAEWEYAARGGKKSRSYQYAGSNNLDEVAWYKDNSGNRRLTGEWSYRLLKSNKNRTHIVKTKQANELGLYDMSGNVWEWCQDWWDDYDSKPVTNPTGPSNGSGATGRGGSWQGRTDHCTVSNRSIIMPEDRFDNGGLRLAL